MPEEDLKALEKALEAYTRSRTASRKRKPANAANPERRSATPIEAGSPRVVGFTIEDSAADGEGVVAPPSDEACTKGGSGTREGGGEGL